jgi:hypothetical protein
MGEEDCCCFYLDFRKKKGTHIFEISDQLQRFLKYVCPYGNQHVRISVVYYVTRHLPLIRSLKRYLSHGNHFNPQ